MGRENSVKRYMGRNRRGVRIPSDVQLIGSMVVYEVPDAKSLAGIIIR